MEHPWIERARFLVHWDHHPSPRETPHYGAGTSAAQIRDYIRAVGPDAMQYHALGCYGYASFPSEVAPPVPGLVGDPLAVWREVCEAEGVPFGIYVATYCAGFPETVPRWLERDSDGAVREGHHCYNGPWTEEFLIPLLYELIDRYRPSHFWLDGAWLGKEPCFCEHCRAGFAGKQGSGTPCNPSAEERMQIKAFRESSADAAFGRVKAALRERDADVLLAGNSAYYFKDLRAPVGVDWLSWDALNTPDWRRVSFESAYLSTAGLPADLMVYENAIVDWGPPLVSRLRSGAHLKTEASSILARGVRFHLWHDPAPDGAIPPDKKETGAKLARFVRERADWCIGAEGAAEVAVLASRREHLAAHGKLDRSVRAVCEVLKQGHVPFEVVRDEVFARRAERYRLVILPETDHIEAKTGQQVEAFAGGGGGVLMIGPPPAGLEGLSCTRTPPLASEYAEAAHPATRDLLLAAVRDALPGPELVRLEAPAGVEVVAMRRDGALYVHLVNHLSGRIMHEPRERFIEQTIPAREMRVSIRTEHAPKSVVLMPGERQLEWRREAGRVEVALPPLSYHYAVRIT